MNLDTIKKIAFDVLGEKKSHSWKDKGNKYYHGERTANLAIKLRQHIIPDDDSYDDILTVAAWFHDVMNGGENHCLVGAEKAREFLSGYCTADELDSICEIISVHDDRDYDNSRHSVYIKLHQDADHLDHFGIFEIWSHFLYVSPINQTMNESIEWLKDVRPTKTEKYRKELNFEISKKIYDEKMEFLERFTERFAVEGKGEIWNEDKLLK